MNNERFPPGQVLPEDLVRELVEGLPSLPPSPERAATIKASLLERVQAGRSHFVTIRGDEGEWVEIAPHVHSKLLHDDGRARSFLLRLSPGARLPAHGHAHEETCLVLEGSAQLGGLEVHAGDFHIAHEGSVHGEVTSRSGVLLFIRAASGATLRF